MVLLLSERRTRAEELQIAQAFANNGAKVCEQNPNSSPYLQFRQPHSFSTDITGRRKDALDTAVSTHGKALAHPKGRMIPVVVDITDKAALAALVQEVSKSERHVDVLVNNAGVSLASSTVEKGDESAQALQKELWAEDQKDWEDTYKTNVIG